MPHCVIEYSKNLNSLLKRGELVEAVHSGAVNSGFFEASHVRTRSSVYEDYLIGYPVKDFIHVTLKIQPGRNQQQKKQLSGVVLGELEKIGLTSVSLTVEVIEIDKDTYSRKIIQE